MNRIDQPFQQIMSFIREPPFALPLDGRAVRGLSGKEVDVLLRCYDIPMPPDTFVFEKKIVYLVFLGCTMEFIHAVLD